MSFRQELSFQSSAGLEIPNIQAFPRSEGLLRDPKLSCAIPSFTVIPSFFRNPSLSARSKLLPKGSQAVSCAIPSFTPDDELYLRDDSFISAMTSFISAR